MKRKFEIRKSALKDFCPWITPLNFLFMYMLFILDDLNALRVIEG